MNSAEWMPFYEREPEPGQIIILRQGNHVSTQRYEAGAYQQYYRWWDRHTAFWTVLGPLPSGHPTIDPNTYELARGVNADQL